MDDPRSPSPTPKLELGDRLLDQALADCVDRYEVRALKQQFPPIKVDAAWNRAKKQNPIVTASLLFAKEFDGLIIHGARIDGREPDSV